MEKLPWIPGEVEWLRVPGVFAGRAGAGHVSWNSGLEDRGWDRRRGLLGGETAAILAIGPAGLRRNRATGIPRRTAHHRKAISRLVLPLDAARAVLHHDDYPSVSISVTGLNDCSSP
jgi:hypothetical protein